MAKQSNKKSKKDKDINLPKQDIKVEKGQPTFLPALKKIVKPKNNGK